LGDCRRVYSAAFDIDEGSDNTVGAIHLVNYLDERNFMTSNRPSVSWPQLKFSFFAERSACYKSERKQSDSDMGDHPSAGAPGDTRPAISQHCEKEMTD
tara:strand:- start:124 stop:420 length:297 start_codon:yes stop_codon:yes gene_type:complete